MQSNLQNSLNKIEGVLTDERLTDGQSARVCPFLLGEIKKSHSPTAGNGPQADKDLRGFPFKSYEVANTHMNGELSERKASMQERFGALNKESGEVLVCLLFC